MLLAVFQVLISRYCRQDDICVASPISNRPLQETEKLIGPFVNILILRANIEDNPAFAKFLSLTRETVLQALNHASLPMDEIVSMLHPLHSLGSTPFPQVMFALMNNLFRLPMSGELAFEAEPGQFIFNCQLFEQATVARMADCYIALLTDIGSNAASVFQLNIIMEEQEKKLLLNEWTQSVVFSSN